MLYAKLMWGMKRKANIRTFWMGNFWQILKTKEKPSHKSEKKHNLIVCSSLPFKYLFIKLYFICLMYPFVQPFKRFPSRAKPNETHASHIRPTPSPTAPLSLPDPVSVPAFIQGKCLNWTNLMIKIWNVPDSGVSWVPKKLKIEWMYI